MHVEQEAARADFVSSMHQTLSDTMNLSNDFEKMNELAQIARLKNAQKSFTMTVLRLLGQSQRVALHQWSAKWCDFEADKRSEQQQMGGLKRIQRAMARIRHEAADRAVKNWAQSATRENAIAQLVGAHQKSSSSKQQQMVRA